MHSLPEILLIDKPKGITSFDVIRQLRRKTGVRKFGHAGTLDPLASGLMLIGVEKGTKLLAGLVGLDKEYEAEILLGEQRSTGDQEGIITAEREYEGNLAENDIKKVLSSLLGEKELPVSAYSAIKKGGVPMYKRARAAEAKGELVEDVPSRPMKILVAELLSTAEIIWTGKKRLSLQVRFSVGSGTYIRSLAEEIGEQLNYPATLKELRRTKIGEYKVENAASLEDFKISK